MYWTTNLDATKKHSSTITKQQFLALILRWMYLKKASDC